MLSWAYVGGGTWELQGAVLSGIHSHEKGAVHILGNIYGSKFDNKASIAIELVADGKVVSTLYESGLIEGELKDLQQLCVAHLEDVLRTALGKLKVVF